MYFNLLGPLLVSVFYIEPLFESLVVPDYLSLTTWKIIRIGVVVTTICLRMLTFREEL